MVLATSDIIRKIDNMATDELGISMYELIERAGEAVASVVEKRVEVGAKVLIFAGKGNNGADGYATAKHLMKKYDVCVYDVFGVGQKGNDGKRHLEEFISLGGMVQSLKIDDKFIEEIKNADCILDAIFGIGFSGTVPGELIQLAEIINRQNGAEKIAIDSPLGVNADDGSVDTTAVCRMSATVSLSLLKPGHVSYPAKEYVGIVENDNIGLPFETVLSQSKPKYYLVDKEFSKNILPCRETNSNKGTFGKVLLITGSDEYCGAGKLTLESALRGGAGLVTYLGVDRLVESLSSAFPEAIYKRCPSFYNLSDTNISEVAELSKKHTATLIGSGCGKSEGLYRLVKELIISEGGALVLDADAINVLADKGESGSELLKNARRKIILTPHPLEFARLIGKNVDEVQMNRLSFARRFAQEYGCTLVLKGAATIITNGDEVYINSSGSSALAKAGSGDVLAGFLASMIAWSHREVDAAAFSVYVHGAAADRLAEEFSEIGVTPSDLPKEMARTVADL